MKVTLSKTDMERTIEMSSGKGLCSHLRRFYEPIPLKDMRIPDQAQCIACSKKYMYNIINKRFEEKK